MKALLAMAFLLAMVGAQLSGAGSAAAGGSCNGGSGFQGGAVGTGVGVGGRECGSGAPGAPVEPVSSGPATRSVTCDLSAGVSDECRPAQTACTRLKLPPTRAVVTYTQQPDGSWRQTGVDCDGGPGIENEALAVTPAMVREYALRLIPPVAIGIAPAAGPTLVNLETILWSPTPATVALPAATILGQNVAITLGFDHATYVYGDGATGTATSPGTPWTAAACATAQCPTLFGHTYTTVAEARTISATITWTATFTVAGGPAQRIPGRIDGPTATHTVAVLQGRSVITR